MRTYVAKGEEAEALKVGADWFVVDATNQVLGRLATKIARMLMGKDKPSFTPYLDSGDHVVVINADKVRMTGNKVEQKVYYSHSGYPGRIEGSAGEEIAGEQGRLDDSRSGSRHAAEEQAARAPGEEVAHVPRCGWFGAARRAEAAADCVVSEPSEAEGSGIVVLVGVTTCSIPVSLVSRSDRFFPRVAVPSLVE